MSLGGLGFLQHVLDLLSRRILRSRKRYLKDIFCSYWAYVVVRVGLSMMFVFGGGVKLLDAKGFARVLSPYDLIPESLLPVVAIGLPALEVSAGIGLLLDTRRGLDIIAVLLSVFTMVIAYGILRGIDVDCGCFGSEWGVEQHSLRIAFYRDLILIGVVVPFLYLSRRVRDIERENG